MEESKSTAQDTKKEIYKYAMYGVFLRFAAIPASFMNLNYTDNLMIDVATVGSILLFARIVDFIFSFFVGPIMESASFKNGKYIPWVQISRPMLYVGLLISFLPFKLSTGMMSIVIVVGYLLTQIASGLMTTVQYGALGLIGAADMDKRNQMNIVSVRLGTVIGVVTSYTTSYVRNFLASIFGQQYQYFVVAIIYGAAYLATTGLMVSLLKPYDGVSAAGGPSRPRVKISIGDMVKAIFTNSQLLVNFISGFMFFTGAFAPMQIVMYYYVYIRNDPQLTLYATAQTATMLFSLATTVVGPAIGLKLGRLKAMLYGQLLTAISGLLMILFGSISIYAFIGINMFTGLATSLYSGFGFSYIIDCGEYGYWKSGVDNRVVVNSLGSIPMKIAQLIAGTVALYGMSMIGFTAGMEVTDSFTKNFMVLYGGIPLVCNSIAFICNLLFYKIDDKEAELYARENREREAAAAAALES